ncbi:TPR protein [Pyrenophora tritici-repentis]|nr:TPR protein [Pyrenophora tritici-repentis]KAI2478936.1 TPR protein [Pyrenophora tritici-repentis]
MRLPERDNNGKFILAEFGGETIPRYAILSHTWGADYDEITLADVEKDTYTSKAGYRKLQFCADQSAKHGIRYFWVDTCCIDKSSSAELTEAINSMFAWYRDATRCYVYLTDVSAGSLSSGPPPTQQDWYPAFQQSRWFTRGWTLQELVAPVLVEFFSVEGQHLGDKYSLLQELHGITGISVEALHGSPLDEFSVDERMSWVGQRQTKREEDMAYSLLGLFDVHMPLIYGEGRKKAVMRLQKEINASSLAQPAPRREPFSTLPFAPDPDFVDRPEIVAWVRDKCAGAGARAALVGLGGVGKSQLAIRYLHSVRDASPQTFVFWVHASTRARFEEAYRDIADRLQLPGSSDPKVNVLQLVKDWLQNEANGRWLMVLDNADDVETFFPSRKRKRDKADGNVDVQKPLAEYLPQSCNGAILVTSRSKDAATRLVGGHNKIKEVLAMDEGEGLQLLRKKLHDRPVEESAVELLRALDCIPLAITQAAAYIHRRARMTVTGYIDEFRKNNKKRKSLLDWDAGDLRRDPSASNSVVTTWQISFEEIRQERPSAAELLSLMSFFNPQCIPESTLRRYSKRRARAASIEDKEEADSAFNEDLDTLRAYCLVSTTTSSGACEMHALVQFCTKVWLSSFGHAAQWEERFLELMAQELPDGDYENWTKCQQLLPHVERIFDAEPVTEDMLESWSQVLSTEAAYLCSRGRYNRAQQIATKAFSATKGALGMENRMTLGSAYTLAEVLHFQGKYKEAEKLHRQVIEGYAKLPGEQRYTLRGMSQLATVVEHQGRYEEAETLHRQALRGLEEVLGGQHMDVFGCMSGLASILRVQEKYEEAETIFRRALKGYEKKLEGRHPWIIAILNNLATVLQDQGKYEEAEKLHRQALKGFEEVLGERHPDTLKSVSNLAVVLDNQGKYEESEELNRYALKEYKEALGERHPDTLRSMSNLALVLDNQGKYEESEELNQYALKVQEEESEELNRYALKVREEELGEHHPDTLLSAYHLAYLLHKLRQYAEAAELYQRAYNGFTTQLGPIHQRTTECRKNFAAMKQVIEWARSIKRERPLETTPIPL